MDGLTVKKELDDGEITIEYNDVSALNQTLPLKNARLKSKTTSKTLSNKNKTPQLDDKVLIPYKTPKLEPKTANNNVNKISQSYAKNEVTKSMSFSHINKSTTDIVITKVDSEKCTLDITKVTKNKVVNCSNVNVSQNGQTDPFKKNLKTLPGPSHNTNPSTSHAKPIHPLLDGATFLHTQVHSNSVLQSLLKDIVSLNNEEDNVDEDAINEEIAKLRSENNLPSFNVEDTVTVETEDSDYSYGSEDENYSYYNFKDSENYGKDSGYDNESQYSESLEEDNRSDVQENFRNEGEKQLMITEPEYIDLDNYYGINSTQKPPSTKGSLADIKTISKNFSSYVPLDSVNSLNQNSDLTCPECKRTLKTKKTYMQHTQNGSGCIKKRLTRNNSKQSNANEILPTTEQKQVSHGLFKCIGKCKFYGTKKELWEHTRKEHLNPNKNEIKDNTVSKPNTCKECYVTFANNSCLLKHYRKFHRQSLSCLFCDFVCDYLSDYNLHIASKHSKRLTKEESLEESDGIEIIEIDDDS